MKMIFAPLFLASCALASVANAQSARIDYAKQGAGWMDQNGAPSIEMGYDGVSRRMPRDDNRNDGPQVGARLQVQMGVNADRRRWRDTRANQTWDQSVHNGYYARNNNWRYGQPTARQMQQKGFAMGYRPWTRGQSLGSYNQRFAAVDYRSRKLSAPPRGYRWVEDDRGDYLLAAIVGGLIAQVVINSPR
ncbi:MAG: hypothetical protein RL186_21 [Pseudomonadota bacterium]